MHDDKKEFRKFLESTEVDLAGTDIDSKLQQAAVMAVYKACLTLEDVEVRQTTERKANKLPPTVTDEEIDLYFGWHEAILLKVMRRHYSAQEVRSRMRQARITGRL